LLGVPFVFTGHSLGRVKQQRLLENGLKPEKIESRYHITQRIEAEEVALDHAAMVVASTQQEVEEQYALYDNHHDN
ncbi:MAG: HAD family hydrolase, partial [Anaerolineae bacterium]|nr:HAD family hydrolase [Anaerolineae bacterium]